MPTVIQLVRDVLPPGTKVVAGENGLYGEVSWIVTLRPTPPGFDSLKGSELALVGTGVLSGLGTTLSQLVSTLAERQIGAIAVSGEINAEACRAAQSRDIPLIQLPLQTNPGSLETSVARFLNEERQFLYQKEREYSQSLMEIAVAGGGGEAIMKRLGELTGRSIGFVGVNLKPHFTLKADLARAFPAVIQKVISRLSSSPAPNNPPIIGMSLAKDQACFVGPVKVGRENKGYLMLTAPEEEIAEIDRLAVRVGSLALAVELSRRQAVKETEGRFEEDIVQTLISGEFSSEIVNEKARRLDVDLSTPHVAMVVQPAESAADHPAMARKVVLILPKALTYFRGENLIILYPARSVLDAAELRQLGGKVADSLSESARITLTIGVGRPYSAPDGIRLSFQEAEQALAMGIKLFGEGSVTSFGDLGVYRLLFSLKSGDELKAFHREYLGKLADYEDRHGGELRQTLKAYLQRGTVAETARDIHVHRNTLLYRLGRIKEITGLDLEDGDTRLAMHLAILAGETLHVL